MRRAFLYLLPALLPRPAGSGAGHLHRFVRYRGDHHQRGTRHAPGRRHAHPAMDPASPARHGRLRAHRSGQGHLQPPLQRFLHDEHRHPQRLDAQRRWHHALRLLIPHRRTRVDLGIRCFSQCKHRHRPAAGHRSRQRQPVTWRQRRHRPRLATLRRHQHRLRPRGEAAFQQCQNQLAGCRYGHQWPNPAPLLGHRQRALLVCPDLIRRWNSISHRNRKPHRPHHNSTPSLRPSLGSPGQHHQPGQSARIARFHHPFRHPAGSTHPQFLRCS
jgi:hypothetical protein